MSVGHVSDRYDKATSIESAAFDRCERSSAGEWIRFMGDEAVDFSTRGAGVFAAFSGDTDIFSPRLWENQWYERTVFAATLKRCANSADLNLQV